MNRTDRLVAMVMFLQGRRLVRAAELAAHFDALKDGDVISIVPAIAGGR